MFVLGTAGHIDHGKSSLILKMTGIDPDRLPEEVARGMTIDLGFAWLKLPDGNEVGLIDVPGHERFVRNMVAGAGGINAAMLVIAADDGWMPQTQEHFDILNLLGLQHGLVALTKIDLVDRDWLELVQSDIRGKLAGTFLAECPIIPVSSTTGEGMDRIVDAIAALSNQIGAVEDIDKLRIFIDRAFLLTGIGVVITGTSRGGSISANDPAYHFPSERKLKIRALQSHEKSVDQIGAGHRVAVNLSGMGREDIKRGDVITGFPYKARPTYLAVQVTNLVNSGITLSEGRKVLLILGTTEREAIIRPFKEKGIKPGEVGLAIVKVVEPVAAFLLDNFILRLPTPQVTVGGGKILDILNSYPKRKKLSQLESYLNSRVDGNLHQLVLTELEKSLFTREDELLLYSGFSQKEIKHAIRELADRNTIIEYEGGLTLRDKVNGMFDKLKNELKVAHEKKSYLKGLTVDQLARGIDRPPDDNFNLLLKYLESTGSLERTNQFYRIPGFAPTLDEKLKREAEKIVSEAEKAAHNYLKIDELEKLFPGCRKTISFLCDDNRLKRIGTRFVVSIASWNEIASYIKEKLIGEGKVTVAEYRDRFSTSRKYALPVLEHLDQVGITSRDGDFRMKGVRFDELHSI